MLPDTEREVIVQKIITRWGADFHVKDFRKLLKTAPAAANGSSRPADAPPCAYLPTQSGEKLFPNDLARLVMRDHDILLDRSQVVREYNGRYWEAIPEGQLQSYALSLDSHEYTTARRRNEAVRYTLAATYAPTTAWRSLKRGEIPCWNGVVDALTKKVRPHQRGDFLETVIPHSYNPLAKCPTWLGVLDSWMQDDSTEETSPKIAALQEFFGYILLPHARYKKALFLQGESDTGKSQVPLIISELVGIGNRCTLSTDQMADERKRAPIVGKMVNLLTELPANAMIADGGFKQLVSTGDPISIDPKFVNPFDYVPFCKHVVCTNKLPVINDHSRATFNRLLLIKFHRVFAADEMDKDLQDKLILELDGILAWSVEGAARLIANNGEFTRIPESESIIAEYRRDQNPINEFIEERCESAPRMDGQAAGAIPMEDFRNKFRTFSGKQYGINQIAGMITSAGYRIEPRNVNGHSRRCLIGFAWLNSVDVLPFDPGPESRRWRQ